MIYEELLDILKRDTSITAKEVLSLTRVIATKNENDNGFTVKENPFSIFTKIVLKKGDILNLKKDSITTTVGCAIVNKLLKVDCFGELFEYVDEDAMSIGKFNNQVTLELFKKTVTTTMVMKFYKNTYWLSRFADMAMPSYSRKILTTPKKSEKLRKELMIKHKDLVDNGDIAFVNKVENVVLDSIIKELDNDPSMILYSLGKPKKDNQLKQCISTLSPLLDPATGKFYMPDGNFSTGLDPKYLDKWANFNIVASYGRAVNTQDGGSMVKSIYNAMNTIVVDVHGTDCGSTRYKTVTISKFNSNMYIWNYFLENGKLRVLEPDIVSSYVGKQLKFRTALYCRHESKNKTCNICAGELPYIEEMTSIGNLCGRVGFNFVKLALKGFHDSTIKVYDIDPFKFMELIKK